MAPLTINDLISGRYRVFAKCQACGAFRDVDLHAAASAAGHTATLMNRAPPCRACDGFMFFYAQLGTRIARQTTPQFEDWAFHRSMGGRWRSGVGAHKKSPTSPVTPSSPADTPSSHPTDPL